MANWRVLAQTFLDGLCPLDALVERPVRPGENLIDVHYWPPRVLNRTTGEIREPRPHDFDERTHREAVEHHGF